MSIDLIWSQTIINSLVAHKLNDFIVSPGMRNAPLALAIKQNKDAQFISIFDERSAGFFALGSTYVGEDDLDLIKPCVLICTSGSAMAHYFPAILEAHNQLKPMLILTADRPPENLYSGTNQTTIQQNFFQNFAIESYNLPSASERIPLRFVETIISQAVFHLKNPNNISNVVHINIPLNDDLWNQPLLAKTQDLAFYGTKFIESDAHLSSQACQYFTEELGQLLKDPYLIALGLLTPYEANLLLPSLRKILTYFPQGKIYCDITSQLKLNPALQAFQLKAQDLISLKSSNVLRIGGPILSKSFEIFLKSGLKKMIHLGGSRFKEDPTHSCSLRIPYKASPLLEEFLKNLSLELDAPYNHLPKINRPINQSSLNYEDLVSIFIQNIPKQQNVFLGNSTPVRAFDHYCTYPSSNAPAFFATRGLSGIDGQISTALGISYRMKKPMFIFVGDITFLHDLNALTLVKQHPYPIFLVVINNYGGRIFHKLSIRPHLDFLNPLINTPHQINFMQMALSLGIHALQITSAGEWQELIGQIGMQKQFQTTLIEIVMQYSEDDQNWPQFK